MKNYIKFFKSLLKNPAKFNLLFVFVFLNIWDLVVNRTFFNGMLIGFLMFGPSMFLWLIKNVRSAALITLISIFEFLMLAIFVGEGFELAGAQATLKSLFWLPYLLMAGINGVLGLRSYSSFRRKKSQNFNK